MTPPSPSADGLESGAAFYRRLILLLTLMSVLSISVIALYLHSLLRFSEGEWEGFLQILAVLGPLLFVVSSLQNRPAYQRVIRYLDAEATGEGTAEGLREAFRSASGMPYRLFLNGLLWWSSGGALVAAIMAWRFEAFSAFRAAAVVLGATSGGFVCSVFVYFGLKQLLSPLCRELGRRIGDPTERHALVRPVALGRKLRWSVTGVTSVTVAFALFFSLVHVSEPLERNAVEIQARFLAARAAEVRDDPGALERVRQEARDLGIASELLWVDLAERVVRAGDPGALLGTEIASLHDAPGRSTTLDSPNAFAWQPIGAGAVLVAVQPWERLSPSIGSAWLRFGITLLVSAGIALGLAQGLARDVGVTTAELGASAERVASGDLRRAEVVESEDELGDLARAFERMAAALRATVGRVSETADRVEATASETAIVSESVAASAGSQSRGVVETVHSMHSLTGQVADISGAAQELNLLVEDASSSIMELGASGEQLAETANTLLATVDDVSSSIQESAQSMREVSTNTAALSEVADDTSASSVQMSQNMREVSAAAEENAARSRQVVETAERGRATVRQTVESMTVIRRATDSAEQVIRGLGERAGEIGSIVDVIGDVADETNLLALNAAIIAAQAGEHGRAFSVVAEEIKELADRVLSSTREVADLIRAVQEESGNAVEAMAAGASHVAEGVKLADEAGASLEEITRVSRESGEGMERILTAVQEQTRASAYVVEQMESVKRGVDAIQRATAEQDRGNEAIVQSTESMREIARQLQATTAEQARGSRRIRESIEGVRNATESINTALRLQSGSAEEVGGFLEELASKGETNEESARRMQEVTRQLMAQAAALRDDVERFRL